MGRDGDACWSGFPGRSVPVAAAGPLRLPVNCEKPSHPTSNIAVATAPTTTLRRTSLFQVFFKALFKLIFKLLFKLRRDTGRRIT